jgi:hypothetical protein
VQTLDDAPSLPNADGDMLTRVVDEEFAAGRLAAFAYVEMHRRCRNSTYYRRQEVRLLCVLAFPPFSGCPSEAHVLAYGHAK